MSMCMHPGILCTAGASEVLFESSSPKKVFLAITYKYTSLIVLLYFIITIVV